MTAQAETKQHRIAIFHYAIPAALLTKDSFWSAFIDDLRDLGHIAGENLVVEPYSAEGQHERYAVLARQIVARQPDAIVTVTNPLAVAVTVATNSIPVVGIMFDPLKEGLVSSLARPGGNLTGVNLSVGVEIWGKLLEILKEAIPSASTIAFVGGPGDWQGSVGQVLRDAGGRLGVSVIPVPLGELAPSEFERAFALMAQQRPDAVLVSGGYAQRQLIVELAAKNRLPAMYPLAGYAEQGGLMAYFADPAEAHHRLADDVHQILRGTKAGDIPIYQASKFRLVINLKIAKALGLAIPQSILARADEVIE